MVKYTIHPINPLADRLSRWMTMATFKRVSAMEYTAERSVSDGKRQMNDTSREVMILNPLTAEKYSRRGINVRKPTSHAEVSSKLMATSQRRVNTEPAATTTVV